MSDAGKCLRCGAQVAEGLGSCVEMYHMVLAREYSNALFASVHLYTADAYILQHSEEHGPRSNAFHLMRLCYLLEHDGSPATGGSNPPNRQQFETLYAQFPFLNPPAKRGALTVADLFGQDDPIVYRQRAQAWAQSVWNAWSEHHAWARAMTGQVYGV